MDKKKGSMPGQEVFTSIFQTNFDQKVTNIIQSPEKIEKFYDYLFSTNTIQQVRIDLMKSLEDKIDECPEISEYFSVYQSQSIYIPLFNLYFEPTNENNSKLKDAIKQLINVLKKNIETKREIYEYIYKSLSQYYHGIKKASEIIFKEHMMLMINLLEIGKITKPKHYYCSFGNGRIEIDCQERKINTDNGFTIVLLFKLGMTPNDMMNSFRNHKTQLVSLEFANGKKFCLEIENSQMLLMNNQSILTLPAGNWISIVISFIADDKKNSSLSLFINGNFKGNNVKLKDFSLDTFIENLTLYNNFIGMISSFMLITKSIDGNRKIPENIQLINTIGNLENSLWNKKNVNTMLETLSKCQIENISNQRKEEIINPSKKKLTRYNLFDEVEFIFTPYHHNNTTPQILDDLIENRKGKLINLIKAHSFHTYQNNIKNIGESIALLPIAEMLLTNKALLTEDIAVTYLTLIKTVLASCPKSMNDMLNGEFFELFRIFFEKFPRQVFTSKIFEQIDNMAEVLFCTKNALVPVFIKYILLNDKLLSNFPENLFNDIWKKISIHCSRMKGVVNLQVISSILIFCEEKKYMEMCCKAHYDEFKPDFVGNSKIMNPEMNEKISNLKEIIYLVMIDIENPLQSDNATVLFKLFTLDLSPCLISFITNIYIDLLDCNNKQVLWKMQLIQALFHDHFDKRIFSSFYHGVLSIRLLLFMFILKIKKTIENFNILPNKDKSIFEECQKYNLTIDQMIKSILIPDKIFHSENANIVIKPNQVKALAKHCASYLSRSIVDSCGSNLFNDSAIVFKEDYYQNYLNRIYQSLFLFIFDRKENEDFDRIIKKIAEVTEIKNVSLFKILLAFCDNLNDIKFTKNFIQLFRLLVMNSKNCCHFVRDKVIINWVLDNAYRNYKSTDVYGYNIYEIAKAIFFNIFITSTRNNRFLSSLPRLPELSTLCTLNTSQIKDKNQSNESYAMENLETLFIWNHKQTKANLDIEEKNILLTEFIQALLKELQKDLSHNNIELNNYPLISNDDTINNNNKFLFDNYSIFLVYLYYYYMYNKNDIKLVKEGLNSSNWPNNPDIIFPVNYKSHIHIYEENANIPFEDNWVDYIFFKEILDHYGKFWNLPNYFGDNKSKYKGKKKYEMLLSDVILNKKKKDRFVSQLNVLCKEYLQDQPIKCNFLKIISMSFALIITTSSEKSQYKKAENYYLVQYKRFLIFLITASSNLVLKENINMYNELQNNCIDIISFGISFLVQHYKSNMSIHQKVHKVLNTLFTIILLIVDYNIKYVLKHKRKIIFKPGRNNLSNCAIFRLFNEICIENPDLPFLTTKKISELQKSKDLVNQIINDEDWVKYYFKNKTLEKKRDTILNIINYFFHLKNREQEIKMLSNRNDNEPWKGYRMEIFLKNYAMELENTQNLEMKEREKGMNKYKKIKKKLTSWNGFWSINDLFYSQINSFKCKILNHYTKYYSKPLIVPIIDFNIYFPTIPKFNIKTLFTTEQQNIGTIDLDIKKIFNISELSFTKEITNNNSTCNTTNYLIEIYRKSNDTLAKIFLLINKKLSYTYNPNTNSLSYLIPQSVIRIIPKEFICCLVKITNHIKGYLNFDKESKICTFIPLSYKDKSQEFTHRDNDYNQEKRTCYGSFIKGAEENPSSKFDTSIKLDSIKYILKRKYFFKNNALEIFTSNHKSYFFTFKKGKIKDNFLNTLNQIIGEPIKIINDLKDQDQEIGYKYGNNNNSSNNNKKGEKLSVLLKKWQKREVSNFELLMKLNFYSNRSYNDITQYPVFPWIFTNYTKLDNLHKEDYFRQLWLPMGMLECSDEAVSRRDMFKKTYSIMKEDESELDLHPYVFGSLYSNPIYVAHYLERLFPFTQLTLELQDGKFDIPDRQFHCLDLTFNTCTSQKTDVRELIPEFFYLPEMFKNINQLNLGKRENDTTLDEVTLPDNDPYRFIYYMRQGLESDNVSQSINKWIDLIFGYKQRGKEAEIAFNVYNKSAYQEDMTFTDDSDEKDQKEKLHQLSHSAEFGLISNQITTKEFVKRPKKDTIKHKVLVDADNNIAIYYKTYLVQRPNNKKEIALCSSASMTMRLLTNHLSSDKDRLLFFNKNGSFALQSISYSKIDKKYMVENNVEFNDIKKLIYGRLSNLYKTSAPIINHIAFSYNNILQLHIGGLSDGKIIITKVSDELKLDTNKYKLEHSSSAITAIAIDKNNEFVYYGNEQGNIMIYTLQPFQFVSSVFNHSQMITHINVNDELNLWASTSHDGLVNLYTQRTNKLIRSFIANSTKCDNVFLVSSPIPSIVIYSQEKEFISYSINGEKIHEVNNHSSPICNSILFKDSEFNDYLAYFIDKQIYITDLPYMNKTRIIGIESHINSFDISEDNTMIYVSIKNDNTLVIIKALFEEDNKQTERSITIK